MRELHAFDYEFSLKPRLFGGYVLMFRETKPAGYPGNWIWGRWRKATWKEMLKFNEANLK